jgi:hypothetical protein
MADDFGYKDRQNKKFYLMKSEVVFEGGMLSFVIN